MLVWCQSGTLYKGLLTLVLAMIAVELLFGTFIETRRWDHIFPFNATKVQFPVKLNIRRHPLVKTLMGDGSASSSQQRHHQQTARNNSSQQHQNISNLTALFESAALNFNSSTLDGNATYVYDEESFYVENVSFTGAVPVCPDVPPNLRGRIPVIKTPVVSILDLEKKFSWLKPGGRWFPESCRALKRVAIVVPFRCRGEHLLIFLRHMHLLLRKQQLDYTIFVIEQEGDGMFNRAMLMNVGYVEALKIRNYDCFIFHDVDLLPEDDRNLYTCPEQPRHMSVAVNNFKYKLPYPGIFGGVCAITTQHFGMLNGFSNSFWGWGGEDDDMSNRIRFHKLHISRYPVSVARYTMLTHKKDRPSPHRYELLKSGQKRFDKDGINNLKYSIKELQERLLYTWLLVELEPPS